jgi:hypothetical protein
MACAQRVLRHAFVLHKLRERRWQLPQEIDDENQ